MENGGPSESVLAFWFGTASDDATVARQQSRLWWAKDSGVDADIRQRFGGLLHEAVAGRDQDWPQTARGRLAKIILLDQFSRNMYRGTPAAFAADPLARDLAHRALDQGDERSLTAIQRVFLYMPFEHAEDPALQDLAVERFTRLRDDAPLPAREAFEGFLDYALRHRDIIRRFGRFPHRNAMLGRPSTREETEFLKQPGSSF